jgi:hypothetical protein
MNAPPTQTTGNGLVLTSTYCKAPVHPVTEGLEDPDSGNILSASSRRRLSQPKMTGALQHPLIPSIEVPGPIFFGRCGLVSNVNVRISFPA